MQLVDENDGDIQFLGLLSKKERRVLGVLIEKSLTTPEYYPLTLKALATGCNQKSNRDPISNYDEFEIEDILDGLRQRGMISAVQTAGGRTERYRHRLRDITPWTAAQLAVMGELLLRGRQQLGELRSRASRMSAIESLEDLRRELNQLMQMKYVQSSGDLSRRGIEVDHALYTEAEQSRPGTMLAYSSSDGPELPNSSSDESKEESAANSAPKFENSPENRNQMVNASPPTEELLDLQSQISDLTETVQRLEERIDSLERQLGV
ncbi:MAG TPA: DUF480 domain-containing protein [Planctomycetaceae bacterium]|nr:DUF480 domain-containing protein [Planctomycetaceae bacterium]|tara:strand:+ start:295 stop:1089 length:795 start_codon:yes stop_codon:yes gene_type:complete